MPEVSVLIPAYRSTFLRQAIASVLSQTYRECELLVSDDCPDGSVRAVVAEFRDSRLRYMEGPRQGLVANSARLYKEARCDFVKFVHDDDFLLPFALARMTEALEQHPEAAFLFCYRHLVNRAGRVVKSPRAAEASKPVELQPAQLVNALLGGLHNSVGEPINVMIRKSRLPDESVLSRYAGYPVRHLIDLAFFFNALDAGTCVLLPEFHAAFRQHPEQTSAVTNPAFSAALFEWDLFLRGEADKGRCPLNVALAAASKLDRLVYTDRMLEAFPEAAAFKAALPELVRRLKAGEGPFLDEDFRTRWTAANDTIERRVAAGSV
jgi:glycosyltransferase involved in cell wall biosynthesis